MRSSADSVISYESVAPSIATQQLGPLQQKGGTLDEGDRLSPLLEDDPHSFDLVPAPIENERALFSLENRSDQLFSKEHLHAIFADTASLLRFTSFLSTYRPNSLPKLVYYLDALKALRAINYANAVAEALEPIDGLNFTETRARSTVNASLEEKANQAFDILVRDDLPAFITHVFVQVASASISKRVTGNLPPMLREASEGLAEVFCLTDPSRTDNPIIFASEGRYHPLHYVMMGVADQKIRISPHDTVRGKLRDWSQLSIPAGTQNKPPQCGSLRKSLSRGQRPQRSLSKLVGDTCLLNLCDI